MAKSKERDKEIGKGHLAMNTPPIVSPPGVGGSDGTTIVAFQFLRLVLASRYKSYQPQVWSPIEKRCVGQPRVEQHSGDGHI
jgi:hypothetical protein